MFVIDNCKILHLYRPTSCTCRLDLPTILYTVTIDLDFFFTILVCRLSEVTIIPPFDTGPEV
jgi:hypothetical protein